MLLLLLASLLFAQSNDWTAYVEVWRKAENARALLTLLVSKDTVPSDWERQNESLLRLTVERDVVLNRLESDEALRLARLRDWSSGPHFHA